MFQGKLDFEFKEMVGVLYKNYIILWGSVKH